MANKVQAFENGKGKGRWLAGFETMMKIELWLADEKIYHAP